jgi:hypothetical protein
LDYLGAVGIELQAVTLTTGCSKYSLLLGICAGMPRASMSPLITDKHVVDGVTYSDASSHKNNFVRLDGLIIYIANS